MRKTKIVCTIGPASTDEKIITDMCKAGMNVARLNFSHGTHEERQKKIDIIKKVRTKLNLPIAVMLDTKGPEYRIRTFKDGKIELKAGAPFTFTTDEVEGDQTIVSVSYKNLNKDLNVGDRILLNNGLMEFVVKEIKGNNIITEVTVGGVLSDRKSMSFPNKVLKQKYLSEQDKQDILFGIKNEVAYIACSFVSQKQDLLDVKQFLKENDGEDIDLIAKIENQAGVDNIEEICEACEGIMIGRGDMGVEIPLEDVPVMQKMIIKKACEAGKIVITATQMLDSMMKHPRPTRAESTDVANAIYDGTSAIMLSGETAAGMYPIEAVKTMVRIATRTEQDINYLQRFRQRRTMCNPDVTNAISHATCTMAGDLSAAAIVTVTKSGRTARMISKYRPNCTIIGECLTEKVCRQLNLEWGVEPVLITEEQDASQLFEKAVDVAEMAGFVSKGELVVLTGGVPLGVSGTTNLIKVQVAGHILVTGKGLNGKKISGNLCVCHSNEDLKSFKDGDIIVAADTTNEMMAQMRQASALIVEAEGANCHAAIAGLSLDIPVLIAAKNALDVLKTSAYVEVDCESGVVSAN